MRKLLTPLFVLALFNTSFAQDAQPGFLSDPLNHPMAPFYGLMILLLVVIVLVIIVAAMMIRVVNTMTERAARERAERLGIPYKPRPSFWSRFTTIANAAVPVEEEKSIELDHEYDGIKELDNHLPPWWKWLFYATVVWAVVYMFIYHMSGSMPLMEQEYNKEVAQAEEAKRKFLATQPKAVIDESALTYTADAGLISKGKDLYTINCAPCHKNDGGGGIGPNLTDEYWLHGGDIKDVYATIKNGVPEKGMVSWAAVMSPEQIRDVSYFVLSLQGTNPPGAKGPQGELYQAAPAAEVSADTLKAQAKL